MKTETKKKVITTLAFITCPVWIVPFCLCVLIALSWSSMHQGFWGRTKNG